MKVVSYFTPPYEGEARKLVASCNLYHLPHNVVAIPDLGSWRKNCGFKPSFILDALLQFKEPVLWIDADGVVNAPLNDLEVAAEHADFGAWFIPNRVMRPADVPGGENSGADGIASGTMLWNYTPAAIGLLMLWQEMDKHDTGRFEQKVLGEAWLRAEEYGHVCTLRMHQRYCKVYDAPWFEEWAGADALKTPVIEHFQASRKLRNKRA